MGNPTRAHLTLTLNQPSPTLTQASVWAETATTWNYEQTAQLGVLMIVPGGLRSDLDLDLSGLEYYLGFFGQLDHVDPSQTIKATLTLKG
jgi:hypothetical protein